MDMYIYQGWVQMRINFLFVFCVFVFEFKITIGRIFVFYLSSVFEKHLQIQ